VCKEGRGAATERALRPGEVLRTRAGAGSQRQSWRLGRRRRDVERQEQASARPRRQQARRRRARGIAQNGAGVVGAQHMASEAARCVGQRNGGVDVDEGGSVCNFPKVQGLHCKA
jgi:hypothetical protein